MLKPGDIIVTMFTYSDLSGAKIRPALVVSKEGYNKYGSVIVAVISSRPVRNKYEIPIENWQEAGLHFSSKLCVGKLMTVNIGLVKVIGALLPNDLDNAREMMDKIFIT